jgi:putative proteasome-type protease
MIHRTWGERLRQVFGEIPDPDWQESANVPLQRRERALVLHRAPVAGDEAVSAKPAQTLAQAEKNKAQR